MEFIASLREKGLLGPEQAARLDEIESGRLLSIHAELRSLLYLGALLVVAGLGGTVRRYIDELGPIAIVGFLTLSVAGCYYHCFSTGKPYSPLKVEQSGAAFDYVLYIGCALLGVEFAYLEAHFHLLDRFWDYYLLASSGLFFYLAYRFDNRLVLAAALLNLGGWLGLRFSKWDLPLFGLRPRALLFGAAVCLAGKWLEDQGRKKHFTDTYLNVGLNALFCAMVSAVFERGFASPYLIPAGALSGLTIKFGVAGRRFQYFLYGVVYAYLAVSACIIREFNKPSEISLYLLVSAVAVLAILFRFRRTLEQRS